MHRFNDEQLSRLQLPLLQWYYEQSNLRHIDLVRIDNSITERGYTLLAVYFAILTAAVGYILTHLGVANDIALSTACISVVVFGFIAMGYIGKVIWPHAIYSPGKMPDGFNIASYINYFTANKVTGDMQFKRILNDELVELQRKSVQLETSNANRSKQLMFSIGFMLLGSGLAVALFMLYTFIL